MNKIQWFLCVVIAILLVAIVYSFFPADKEQTQRQQAQEKALLEKFLFEINLGNFQSERCEELKTDEGKQTCYKTYVIRKIVKNEVINSNLCYKLAEGSDREVCLTYSSKK